MGEFVISSVLSHCNKNLKWQVDQHYNPWIDRIELQPSDWPALQLRVTAQFYSESKGKYIFKIWGKADPKDGERWEVSYPNFFSFFLLVFLLPLNLPYVNWAGQEACLFYLRFSIRSSGLPLFSFHGLFPSLSFSHHHSELSLPI